MSLKHFFAILLALVMAVTGHGVFINTFWAIDRTDMMQAAVYEAPDGTALPYRIYVPENYNPARKYPLVLFLHGTGERGGDNRAHTEKGSVMQTLLGEDNLTQFPCVVVAPQCPGAAWWPLLTTQLMGLLEQTRKAYSVDAARIYITGISLGGYGTWSMLAEYPGYFAAAVPICGGGDPGTAPLLLDIPIWAFHGARDLIVRPDSGGLSKALGVNNKELRGLLAQAVNTRSMVKALQEAGSTAVKYTEYPREGHFCWELAYREPALFEWMFTQTRTK